MSGVLGVRGHGVRADCGTTEVATELSNRTFKGLLR